jgi:hypothetical protein
MMKMKMEISRILFMLFLAGGGLTTSLADPLTDSFKAPPESTKPWCYWYWLNGDITKEGITRDLEAMADVGIRLAMIGNVTLNKKTGPVKMMSPEWMDLTRHAMREGKRLGVDIYMFNGPGWSQSGGPWIKPEQSMRRVMWSEYPAEEGNFSRKVRPDPVLAGQDIAVLALPRTSHDFIEGVEKWGQLVFERAEPFVARALLIDGDASGKLFAVQGGKRNLVANIHASRGNPKTDFLPDGYQSFSFPDTKAETFIFDFKAPKSDNKEPVVKAMLTSEPRVTKVLAKQMGRMHPTPEPTWESYIFPDTVEPADASVLVPQDQILDLTDKLKPDGTLTANLPSGSWTVMYFGMVPTDKTNHPAPPEATGYEVDKMSREHIRHHFKGQFADLLGKLSAEERSVFKGVTIDSYEVGAQNWTDGFANEFKKRNGYDPVKLLPVFTGRVIDSAKTSDQFLWDLRRTVADMISENYVGGLREIAHENGLQLWCENYGHWGFPGDFLSYGGQADQLGGEFWTRPANRGSIECRAASSAAHIYGKQRVFAEAFTSNLNLGDHPYSIKARGEQLFCEGINHFVLHVYAHQPKDGIPGSNPWFGTAFHRNTPWFPESRSWVRYLQRCHLMLQQGKPAADVLVYIGDFAPQMTGPANPVPDGYDYDYIGSDAILRTLHVVDGEWVVYDETNPQRISARWKLLAMPEDMHMRPQVRERLQKLKEQGGRVVESVKVSPQALEQAGIAPALSGASCGVRWKERQLGDGKLFFLSNFQKTGPFQASLRVSGKQPELFNPVTGEVTALARYESRAETTSITIDVKDLSDAFFIVFRREASQPSVVEASAPPSELKLSYDESGRLMAEAARAGTFAVSLSNGTKHEIELKQEPQQLAIDGLREAGKNHEYSVVFDTTFHLPPEFGKGQRIMLELGQVNVMAQVSLNGTTYDTLWMPPFELDVTDALKPGANTLAVKVTSTSTAKPALGKVQLSTRTRQPVGLYK